MRYQHTPKASKRNGFCWDNGIPSIFANDPAFLANKNGLTRTAQQTVVVERIAQKTGRNPGTMTGLSPVADALLARQVGW